MTGREELLAALADVAARWKRLYPEAAYHGDGLLWNEEEMAWTGGPQRHVVPVAEAYSWQLLRIVEDLRSAEDALKRQTEDFDARLSAAAVAVRGLFL